MIKSAFELFSCPEQLWKSSCPLVGLSVLGVCEKVTFTRVQELPTYLPIFKKKIKKNSSKSFTAKKRFPPRKFVIPFSSSFFFKKFKFLKIQFFLNN